jgi:catechol 2,3-dioxygenase-like lactoylglutathione lyase family enzyme
MLPTQRLKAFVSTSQPEKALEFYTKKLGLELLSEDSYGIEFDSGGAHIRITFVDTLSPQPFTVLGWDTNDIVSTVKSLNEKGVSFERYTIIEQDELGIWTAPGGIRVAWFKDPDGNILSVSG